MKKNLTRIAQKIRSNKFENDENPFRITDMTRATITVDQPKQMEIVYQVLDKSAVLSIIKIDSKLSVGIQNVTLNIIYLQQIVGEIEIQCGKQGANHYSMNFLEKLIMANSIFDMRQSILLLLNRHVEKDMLY